MNLALPTPPTRYKSATQRARVSTEPWALKNLFCPNCPSPQLQATDAGTEAIDFLCPRCEEPFQLKSQSHSFGRKIVDAAYDSMMRAIRRDATPNLVALHYNADAWRVVNVLLIPRFVFSASAIEKRTPLGPNARRAGWVGCNILLDAFPAETRIPLVLDGQAAKHSDVRRHFRSLEPLTKLNVERRGWTLDVLRAVESLKRQEFSLEDAYSTESHLARLHPANRHIRPKIRQQLQVLRDLGFLRFLGRGRYRLT
jgi:type II restriction enzyme